MEALSKSSGAETAVWEGDKRRAVPGGWELQKGGWESLFIGELKERRRVSGALDEIFK